MYRQQYNKLNVHLYLIHKKSFKFPDEGFCRKGRSVGARNNEIKNRQASSRQDFSQFRKKAA